MTKLEFKLTDADGIKSLVIENPDAAIASYTLDEMLGFYASFLKLLTYHVDELENTKKEED